MNFIRKYWFLLSIGLVLVFLTIILGWKTVHSCFPYVSNENNVYCNNVGGFLGGFLGAIFSFITILLLIFFEYNRDKDEKHRDDYNRIYTAIDQNREIFNSILFHRNIADVSNKPEYITTSGPTCFAELEVEFMELYVEHLWQFIVKNHIEFADSLTDKNYDEFMDIYHIRENISRNKKETFINNISFVADSLKAYSFVTDYNLKNYLDTLIIEFSTKANKNSIVNLISDTMSEFYLDQGYLYGHYLRNQFYVFETIDGATLSLEEKKQMFKLYRSHLSSYELVIMFYNSLSSKSSTKNNEYLIKNEMLNDLESVKFIHAEFYNTHGYKLLKQTPTLPSLQ